MLLGDLQLDGSPAVNELGKVDGKFAQTMGGIGKLGATAGVAFAGIAAVVMLAAGAVD